MENFKSYTNALRSCAKEHKNEIVPFAHIRTKDICNDTADLLERIDKAIEDIKNLNGYGDLDTMNVGDDLMISWSKTLDILKEISKN